MQSPFLEEEDCLPPSFCPNPKICADLLPSRGVWEVKAPMRCQFLEALLSDLYILTNVLQLLSAWKIDRKEILLPEHTCQKIIMSIKLQQ